MNGGQPLRCPLTLCSDQYNSVCHFRSVRVVTSVLQVICDGASFVVMLPGAVYLTYKQWAHQWSSGKVFTALLSIVTVRFCACHLLAGHVWMQVVYPFYNFTVDAPMYLQRYKADQAAHVHYLPFLEGIKDAAVTR